MELARFNARGIERFREHLGEVRAGHRSDRPDEILSDHDACEVLPGNETVDPDRVFGTRLELAEYLSARLERALDGLDMEEAGVWSWLSALYFDTVCPDTGEGNRKPGSDYRHVPSGDWRYFYRHLIRNPIRVYRLFLDDPSAAHIVLCQHPATPGEYVEQLTSRQERITNRGVIESANRLYLDPQKERPKRGMAPNWRKPGTLRRFVDVLDQLDLTYDLYSMSADDILGLLPSEFGSSRA